MFWFTFTLFNDQLWLGPKASFATAGMRRRKGGYQRSSEEKQGGQDVLA